MKQNYLIIFAKDLIELIYKIKKHKLIVLFFRKPFNTWILPRFYNHKSALKDAEIWKNQNYYNANNYQESISSLQNSYIDYLIKNIDLNDSIIDICCNQGRHLKALHRKGFRNLNGVDIMFDAVEMLKQSQEYTDGGIYVECNLAQSFLSNSKDFSFDYAITFSATIELMHPGFDIFRELYRVLNKGFIFVINENGHTYPRFYRNQINSRGFEIRNIKNLNKDLTLLECIKI